MNRVLTCFLLGTGDTLSLLQLTGELPSLKGDCFTGEGSKWGAGEGEKGDDSSSEPFSGPRAPENGTGEKGRGAAEMLAGEPGVAASIRSPTADCGSFSMCAKPRIYDKN